MAYDYEKLGFKAGLEIHQQLDSHKLFCECPSVLRSDEPKKIVKRKLHLVKGESGEVDVAASFQSREDPTYFYEFYDTNCLVELDEEPPHKINSEALEIALQISLLLNCKIIPITQVMRKTVVDGSNTSGFQRTVLIARDGYVETSQGKVGIDSVYLEEDSARRVTSSALNPHGDLLEEDSARRRGKNEERIIYRLDRLGIPLVEISTRPDLKSPAHVKETALKIGDILRSVKVRRGIGTIRQDLNVSIEGSNRVEIKGFQDPKIMETCLDLEIKRQKSFLDKGQVNPSEVRNCEPDGETTFLRPMPGAARMYPETDLELLHITRDLINKIKKNLPRLKSEIEKDLLKQGLDEDMIRTIFKRDKFYLYKELYEVIGNPKLISKALILYPKEISKKFRRPLEDIEEILNKDVLIYVLERVYKDKLHEKDLKHVFEKIVQGVPLHEAVKLDKKDLGEVEEKIMKIVQDKPGLSPNAYMGLVMKKMKGQVNGEEAMEMIRKFVGK